MSTYEFPVVGVLHSPYKEKFGIPRQPGLAPSVRGEIHLQGEFNQADCVAGLEDCSHIWLQFVFHNSLQHAWRPKVRPPRLGGNQSMGVFATRSPVRPSPIGLSVVKLESIELDKTVRLIISGMDLLDQTPILDIKPYVPYVDTVADASNHFAQSSPGLYPVRFNATCREFCQNYQAQKGENLEQMLVEILQQDPRPAYQQGQSKDRVYGMKFLDLEVRWQYLTANSADCLEIIEIASL